MSKKMMSLKGLALVATVSGVSLSALADGHGIKWNGDLRYRHEMIKIENTKDRHRQRIRARLGAKGKINDSWSAEARISGGSLSATSTNTTLDGGFANKSIELDVFSAKWTGDNSSVTLGKMKNPLYRAQGATLIWDGDVTPEGIAYSYWRDAGSVNLFLNATGFWFDERNSSTATSDAGLLVGQVGAKVAGATFGVSYYGWANLKGQTPLSTSGNTVDANGNYANEYKVLELFADYGMKVGGMKLSLGGSVISNSDASTNKAGHQVGIKLKDKSWWVSYYNMKLEQDATVGIITESDAFGGGTDGSANVVKVGFNLAKNAQLALSYFAGKNTISGTETSIDTAHIDGKFKF